MAKSIFATDLPNQIQQLLEQRRRHTDSINHIDLTLAKVTAALGGKASASVTIAKATPIPPTTKAPAVKGKKQRPRGVFPMSGEASVLAFVKKKAATTKEINQHFKAEGRASTADNLLSKLVAEKKLKRTPLGNGVMGSKYSIA